MEGGAVLKVLLVPLLFVLVAQIVPSCESQEGPIVGYVDDKYQTLTAGGIRVGVIIIGATEYEVPWSFYWEVHIGDLVKYEKMQWIIVRKAGA